VLCNYPELLLLTLTQEPQNGEEHEIEEEKELEVFA
jgi:hypothetical protein